MPSVRPRKKATMIGLRATAAERAAWERAAETDGRSLSDWIARRCNGKSATAPAPTAGDSDANGTGRP
jgi:hypothetical protein